MFLNQVVINYCVYMTILCIFGNNLISREKNFAIHDKHWERFVIELILKYSIKCVNFLFFHVHAQFSRFIEKCRNGELFQHSQCVYLKNLEYYQTAHHIKLSMNETIVSPNVETFPLCLLAMNLNSNSITIMHRQLQSVKLGRKSRIEILNEPLIIHRILPFFLNNV